MRKKLLSSLLFCLLFVASYGQKVGLVLSGGGAKGLYHIGVIKALEDNGIPIDYISGTSMGAIIGGLYAIGMTPDEIYSEFSSEKIKFWMSGKIEDKYQYYFKQMNKDASMLTLRFDPSPVREKRSSIIPSNLIPSHQIDMAFIEYFSQAQVVCKGNFDSLLVPFRCIATDAVRRREVTYRQGDLGKAIRTSMTIPLVFKPIKNDTTILYDGGLYNNFPWQVLEQDFQPDILIGSKCVEGNYFPDQNSLMDQVFALTMMHTDYSLPPDKGIMIDRIFSEVNLLDFSKAEEIVRAGYEDATAKMEEIKLRIERRVYPDQVAARRKEFTRQMPPLLFSDYTVTGLNLKQTHYVRKMLSLGKGEDKTFSLDKFRSEYMKLLSEGEFDGDYPIVEYDNANNLFHLSIGIHTKPSLKLKVGGNISSTALNQAYVGLEYKYIGKSAHTQNFDGYYSPFYVSTSLSARTDFFLGSSFYYQIGVSYNYYNYFRSDYGILSSSTDIAYAKYEDFYFETIIGMPLGRHSVLNLQANAAVDNYNYAQSAKVYEHGDKLDRTKFNFVSFKLEAERNSVNYRLYPTKGIYQKASAIFVVGTERYYPGTSTNDEAVVVAHKQWGGLKFTREHYFQLSKWLSLGYLVDFTLTRHPDFDNANATNITAPAFTPTVHSKIVYMKEFRAPSYAGVGIMPIVGFTPGFYMYGGAYSFLPKDYDKDEMDTRSRHRYMFDLSLVYQTLAGPVSLSISKYDTNKKNWFITFNFGFAIFNQKGLYY